MNLDLNFNIGLLGLLDIGRLEDALTLGYFFAMMPILFTYMIYERRNVSYFSQKNKNEIQIVRFDSNTFHTRIKLLQEHYHWLSTPFEQKIIIVGFKSSNEILRQPQREDDTHSQVDDKDER